jgi:hypothetical protein
MPKSNPYLEQLELQEQKPLPGIGKGSSNPYLEQLEGVEFPPPPESVVRSTARTLAQIPLGALQRFTWGADLIKLLSSGASQEALAQFAEDEPELKGEIAQAAREQALEYFPTQGMAERLIEEKTGLPLTPQNKLQKGIRLGSTAAAFRPKAPVTAGVTAPVVSQGAQALGLPESVAEPLGLISSGVAPEISVSKATKPSGLPVRRFEKVSKPTKVTPARHEKINEAVENDFRGIADQLLQKNRTYSAMKEDTLFKEKVSDLFEKVEDLAKEVPGELHTEDLREAFKKRYNARENKGITPDEFERAFRNEVRALNKEIPFDKLSPTQMVEQFRKNNKSLRELFEPGKSSAYNRAKKEALLEYNRAIEDVISKKYPDSEFKDLFEFTNKRWSEISDIEQIDKFFSDMFEGKINFNKAKEIFRKDKEYVARPFKRILGEEGFNDFKALMEDFMTSEKALGYIKKAKSSGFEDAAKTAGTYLVHPNLAAARFAGIHGKQLWQMLLDKPQLITTWKNSIDNFKAGNYAAAQEGFRQLDKELNSTRSSPKLNR